MKRWLTLLFVIGPLVALHGESNPFEKVVQQPFASGGTVRLHLEAGGYTIKASTADNIVVTYSPNANSDSGNVKVEIKAMASHADVYVRNTPHNNFRATIEVPKQSNLWARMSAGELNIRDVEGDKDVELWAGRINIDVPHSDLYGHRDASVIAGSVEASAFNISKGGLFRSFREDGPGKYRLHAHVTAGEIDVR
jgi:hypothetical protein